MVRQVHVFNSYGFNKLSSSRENDVQNMTFDMCWLSDKLIQTKLAVQRNKTPCVRVAGLIHLKIEVTDNKYILKLNVVTKKEITKLIKEVTCGYCFWLMEEGGTHTQVVLFVFLWSRTPQCFPVN